MTKLCEGEGLMGSLLLATHVRKAAKAEMILERCIVVICVKWSADDFLSR